MISPLAPVIWIGVVSSRGSMISAMQGVRESEEPESSIKGPGVGVAGTGFLGAGSLMVVVAVIE